MLRQAIKIGLIGGIVEVLLSLIGMVEAFSQREIISNVVSMGHTLLLLVAVFMGYLAAKRTPRSEPLWILVNGFITGLLVGGLVALLVIVGSLMNLRRVFVNAMPFLYELLTFSQGTQTGVFLLLGAGTLSGLLAGAHPRAWGSDKILGEHRDGRCASRFASSYLFPLGTSCHHQ
jgi:hypothetical protein